MNIFILVSLAAHGFPAPSSSLIIYTHNLIKKNSILINSTFVVNFLPYDLEYRNNIVS